MEPGRSTVYGFFADAVIYRIQRKFDKSLESIDRCLELAPDSLSALLLKSFIYSDLGQMDKRIEVLEKIVTDDKYHLHKELDKLERQA